ncbi:hypothetical protein [Pedobacter cryoconitis]|uniref:Uncharacterized protein n=1 Tax=Pedobacter cryoconitis TaxID=188932 RepID=A0A7X0J7Q7_9SPHI|nr:hypothetical protein [Pedobacter cryoconitis]MBB6501221.1 hypothetical protein [Pedobacter cryoconitis]
MEKISKVGSNQNHQLIIGDSNAMSNMIIHYYWSLKRYNVLCAKIGFEFLCELKGQDFGQHKRFDTFKKDILTGKNFDKIITPYVDGKGYQVKRLTAPGWISYVNYGKDISGFPVLSSQRPNCHKIFIYSVNGYLLFNVCLFEESLVS